MRRSLIIGLAASLLMSVSAFAVEQAPVAEPMQLTAAVSAPEKAVTSEAAVTVTTLRASEGLVQSLSQAPAGDPDYDSPAPNFASGNPDHDNPVHALIALGVDPDTDTDADHPNTDGISLASIPGDNEDGEGAGRMPLAA